MVCTLDMLATLVKMFPVNDDVSQRVISFYTCQLSISVIQTIIANTLSTTGDMSGLIIEEKILNSSTKKLI